MVADLHLHLLGVVAADFTDPAHERTIYLAAGGLALLGIALLAGTIVWWRATKGEHAALAPLELMGQRSWEKAPYTDRIRRLESVRIRSEGEPVEPGLSRSEEIDLDELLRSFQPGFDDLRDEPALLLVDAVPESQTVVRTPAEAADGEVEGASPAPLSDEPSATDLHGAAASIADAGDIIVDAAAPDVATAPDADAIDAIDTGVDRDALLAGGASDG
ncbi:MAG: hypothetical protein ABIR68_07550 [Ilumatobacteraceae bacterium]